MEFQSFKIIQDFKKVNIQHFSFCLVYGLQFPLHLLDTLLYYSTVKPPCSNFRVFIATVSGVQILRILQYAILAISNAVSQVSPITLQSCDEYWGFRIRMQYFEILHSQIIFIRNWFYTY